MQKLIFIAYRFVIVPALISLTLFVTSHLGQWFASLFASNIVIVATKLPFWSAISGVLTYTICVCIFLLTACLWLVFFQIGMDDTSKFAYGVARLWKRISWHKVYKIVIAILACYSCISIIVTTILYSMPHVERFEPFLSTAYNVEDCTKWLTVMLFILLFISNKKGE